MPQFLMIFVTCIRNVVSILAFVWLADRFDKWWIALFGILTTQNFSFHRDDKEQEIEQHD